MATLRVLAELAPGSTLAMTFLLPTHLLDEVDRPVLAATQQGARQSGTPFVSYYSPEEMVAMARDAGFAGARDVSGASLAERYFSGRSDGLRPSKEKTSCPLPPDLGICSCSRAGRQARFEAQGRVARLDHASRYRR